MLVILAAFLVAGAWLRVAGHNWDQDQHLNADDSYVAKVATKKVNLPPDASLSQLLDPQHSPLNPRRNGEFYVYGTLPLYLDKAATAGVAAFSPDRYFDGVNGILQVGRVLAALFDTLTALLVFLIGRRLWGWRHGLLAAGFYSFAMLPLQEAHFYLTDVFMSTFMAATLLCGIVYWQERRAWAIGLAGLCAGLAMACKLSAAPVLGIPLAAVLLAVFASPRRAGWRAGLGLGALALACAGAGLVAGDPFALLDAGTYINVLSQQASIQAGSTDQWFSRKYVGTLPVLYLLGQLLLVGIVPPVGLAGAVGGMQVALQAWHKRSGGLALFLLGGLLYFASIAFVELKWLRYLLPLVPYLALCAAVFTVWAWATVARRVRRIAPGAALPAVLLLCTVAGGLALEPIFTGEQTQIAASNWIFSHAAPGSGIGYESTAIEMPLALPGRVDPEQAYKLAQLDPLTDRPSQDASDTLYNQLAKVDYLILDGTQAMSTVPRLPWRYPVQIRYYDLLQSGKLGFHLALKETSYPRLFGLEFPDDGGLIDASFMDSSHPPIYVFVKDRTLSKVEWDTLFAQATQQASVPSRLPPG